MSADTSPDVEQRMDRLLAARTGTDRLRMVSEMFDMARALTLADLQRDGVLSDADRRCQLFDRFYGADFDDAERRRIRDRLRAAHPRPPT